MHNDTYKIIVQTITVMHLDAYIAEMYHELKIKATFQRISYVNNLDILLNKYDLL